MQDESVLSFFSTPTSMSVNSSQCLLTRGPSCKDKTSEFRWWWEEILALKMHIKLKCPSILQRTEIRDP